MHALTLRCSCTLALCLALTACNTTISPQGRPAAPLPTATSAPVCPAQDFDKFLAAFANDIEVQKASVTQPLQSDWVDASADPEPKPMTQMLSSQEMRFPLMPSLQRQARDGLQRAQTPSGAREMQVKLFKPDTDYQVLYFFRNDGCWKLYRIRDDSL